MANKTQGKYIVVSKCITTPAYSSWRLSQEGCWSRPPRTQNLGSLTLRGNNNETTQTSFSLPAVETCLVICASVSETSAPTALQRGWKEVLFVLLKTMKNYVKIFNSDCLYIDNFVTNCANRGWQCVSVLALANNVHSRSPISLFAVSSGFICLFTNHVSCNFGMTSLLVLLRVNGLWYQVKKRKWRWVTLKIRQKITQVESSVTFRLHQIPSPDQNK